MSMTTEKKDGVYVATMTAGGLKLARARSTVRERARARCLDRYIKAHGGRVL